MVSRRSISVTSSCSIPLGVDGQEERAAGLILTVGDSSVWSSLTTLNHLLIGHDWRLLLDTLPPKSRSVPGESKTGKFRLSPPAYRFAVPCPQTAAASDDPRPGSAGSTGLLDQLAAGLDQPRLQTRQRPVMLSIRLGGTNRRPRFGRGQPGPEVVYRVGGRRGKSLRFVEPRRRIVSARMALRRPPGRETNCRAREVALAEDESSRAPHRCALVGFIW